MEQYPPDVMLACAILHRTLLDLTVREHALTAARFLAGDWRGSWGQYLPGLRPARLRALVRAALDRQYQPDAEHPTALPTRRQRAEMQAVLASAGLAPGPRLRVLERAPGPDSAPSQEVGGVRPPEPLASPPQRAPGRTCTLASCTVWDTEFCKRAVCHRQQVSTSRRESVTMA